MKIIQSLCLCVGLFLGLSIYTQAHGANISIDALAWNPDGQLLAIAERTDDKEYISIYNRSHQRVQQFEAPGFVMSIAWSPDGTRLAARYATTYHSALAIWSLNTNTRPLLSDEILGQGIYDLVVWSPDGQLIAAEGGPAIRLLNSTTGHLYATLYERETIGNSGAQDLAWSPDGHLLYGLYNKQDTYIIAWDTLTTQIDHLFEKQSSSFGERMAISHDNETFVITDGQGLISLVDVQTSQIERTFMTPDYGVRAGSFKDIAWSSQNTEIIGVADDGMIYIWDARTGHLMEEHKLLDAKIFDFDVSLSSDGQAIAYFNTGEDVVVIFLVPSF